MSSDKKKVREAFRNAVFSRDGHKCRVCGKSGIPLDAHHIVDRTLMPNGGYVKENGITLCNVAGGCHEKAEAWSPFVEEIAYDWSPEALYILVGSSYEKASKASERLK